MPADGSENPIYQMFSNEAEKKPDSGFNFAPWCLFGSILNH
jgi:hypothetical protein